MSVTFIERDSVFIKCWTMLYKTLGNGRDLQLLSIEDTTVRTESGIYPLEGNGSTVEAEDLTDMFELNGVIHWVTSGETSQVKNEIGIVLDSDSIDSTVVRTTLLYIGQNPQKPGGIEDETEIFRLKTTSQIVCHRYPLPPPVLHAQLYGGWIVKLEGSEDSWSETRPMTLHQKQNDYSYTMASSIGAQAVHHAYFYGWWNL